LVGYICKYTPIEVIESFGEKPERLESGFKSRERAEAMLHSNVCSYVKYSLQGTTQGRYLTGGVPPVRFSM